MERVKKKTIGKPIKWIICFWPMLLKVFFGKKAIISSLNNENRITISRGDSKHVVTRILYSMRVDWPLWGLYNRESFNHI